MPEEKKAPEYRFQFDIIDVTNDEIVMRGSTFLSSHISEVGECESVDMEVSSSLRAFNNTIREEYEKQNYSEASPEEDDSE